MKRALLSFGLIGLFFSFLFLGEMGVIVARAEGETPTPITDTGKGVQFLNPSDSMAFNYDDLANPLNPQKIQIGVINLSAETLIISGEIVFFNVFAAMPTEPPTADEPNPGPTATPTPFPELISLAFTTTPDKLSLAPGEATTIKFSLNDGDRPGDGTYTGLIIVQASASDSNTFVNSIQQAFTLHVPAETQPEATKIAPTQIALVSPAGDETLEYDWYQLNEGLTNYSIILDNQSEKEAAVEIGFRFPTMEADLYQEIAPIEIPKSQEILLTFCHAEGQETETSSSTATISVSDATTTSETEENAKSGKDCIEIERTDYEPEPGAYSGYIILTIKDQDETITVKHIPVTLTVSTSETGTNLFVNWLKSSIQGWFGFGFEFGNLEWFLLAAVLVLILFYGIFKPLHRLSWWLRGDPGTVEITLADQSGEENLKYEAEKVIMQEHLAKAGLLPPTNVPGGSIGENIITLIENKEIIPTNWITPLITIVLKIFRSKPGHIVSGTFINRDQEPKKGLTIEIKDVRTGKVEVIKPVWKDSHREAVESAAHFIYHFLTSDPRILRTTPVWARFPTYNIFEQYQRGQLLEKAGKYKDAQKAYQSAAIAAPNNALVRFRLGTLMESNENFKFLDALEAYLEVISIWPRLIEARYRLAVTFSFAKDLVKEWKTISTEQKRRILTLIRSSGCREEFAALREWRFKNIKNDLGDLLDEANEKKEKWNILSLLEQAKEARIDDVSASKIKASYETLGDDQKETITKKLEQLDIEIARLTKFEKPNKLRQKLIWLVKLAYCSFATAISEIKEMWGNLSPELQNVLKFAINNQKNWDILALLELVDNNYPLGRKDEKKIENICQNLEESKKIELKGKVDQVDVELNRITTAAEEIARSSFILNTDDYAAITNFIWLLKLAFVVNKVKNSKNKDTYEQLSLTNTEEKTLLSVINGGYSGNFKDLQNIATKKVLNLEAQKTIAEEVLDNKLLDDDKRNALEEIISNIVFGSRGNLGELIKLSIMLDSKMEFFFLDLANCQWVHILDEEISIAQNFQRFLKLNVLVIVWPFAWNPENKYLRGVTWPSGRLKQFKKITESAQCCTELQLNPKSLEDEAINPEEKIENLLGKNDPVRKSIYNTNSLLWFHGRNWQVRYNAVCFYAIAMSLQEDKEKKEAYEKKACDLLEEIFQDPQSRLPMDWLVENDPDLEPLQKTPRFNAMFGKPAEPTKSPEQAKAEKLCHSWDVLKEFAKQQEAIWQNRWTTIREMENPTAEELMPWHKDEIDIWNSVHLLALVPENDQQRIAFWATIKNFHPGAGDLPKAAMQCTEKSLGEHEVEWNNLSECALKRVDDLQKEDILKMSFGQKRTWVHRQWVLWQSLHYWSKSPLEDALSIRFQNKCKGN